MPVSRHWLCEGSRAAPKQAAPNKDCQALIVADPAENLPAAQQEGKTLFRKLRSQKGWKCRYFGRAMTAAGLSRELPDTDVLHLAAHYVAVNNQAAPGVMMADGPWLPGDSFSTPEIVFANCCHAGLPIGDNGSLSLAGHFLKHGSQHVIAPFLPVCDRAAGEFAREFYQAFLVDKDAAQAVWSAKRIVGPASWMYWHFGPASTEPVRDASPTKKEKRSRFWTMIFPLALIFAAAVPWMKSADTVPTSTSAPTIVTERPSFGLLQPGEQPTGESAGSVAPALEPIESGETASRVPVALIDEANTPAADVPTPFALEELTSKPNPAPLLESESVVVPPRSEADQTVMENGSSPYSSEPIAAEHNVIEVEPPESYPDVEGNAAPIVSHEDREESADLESEITVPLEPTWNESNSGIAEPASEPGMQSVGMSATAGSNFTTPVPDTTPIAESVPERPESDVGIVVEQTQPATAPITAAPHKTGLFDDALAEVDRQQSFEEAAIQVLEGYPERYLKARIKGKPDYNAATGKASVVVEVTIDNTEYRAMAQRLSEVLRKFGHDGEHISATMERPYDSYMEIRFRFSGRKKFRDLLFLCMRANDALTRSEWEFHSLPRSSIDAILSSMSVPVLSVELTDSSGRTIASASQKISRPFLANEDRGFSILPAFNGERSEMTITSVIPGRNHLEVKMEFDLSLEELKQITEAVCTIKKGTRLPDEFTYRFLK